MNLSLNIKKTFLAWPASATPPPAEAFQKASHVDSPESSSAGHLDLDLDLEKSRKEVWSMSWVERPHARNDPLKHTVFSPLFTATREKTCVTASFSFLLKTDVCWKFQEKRSQGAQLTLGGVPVFQWQNSWEVTFGDHKVDYDNTFPLEGSVGPQSAQNQKQLGFSWSSSLQQETPPDSSSSP